MAVVLSLPAKPPEMKLMKKMGSLNVDAIGDAANLLLEAPCRDDDEAILQQAEQVATNWEADLADFEDTDAIVVDANDVTIAAKALNAYIGVDTIVDDSNNLLEVLREDNKAKSMHQAADLVEDLVDFEDDNAPLVKAKAKDVDIATKAV